MSDTWYLIFKENLSNAWM